MAAPRIPPDYPFKHILEYPAKLDPRIPLRAIAYSEPARQTRNIRLLGKQRPLVFFTKDSSRARYFKKAWIDRTEEFKREWSQNEKSGDWEHSELSPEPAPIKTPDGSPEAPPAPPEGTSKGAALVLGENPLAVKKLVQVIASGDYDEYLQEMLALERGKEKPRSGAVSAIATRIGNVTPRS